MTAKFDASEFTAALDQLKRGGHGPEGPQAPAAPASADEWQQREAFKVKVIAARVKLKLMRDRTEALKEALERFRSQRDAMRA